MNALQLTDLGFRYGAGFALDGVGLAVAPGQFTLLLGPNGAGKSTLVNLMTGLYAPSSGKVEIGGHDLSRAPTKALARLGVVFQQSTLDLDLTVSQNLRYAAALHGIVGKDFDAMGLDGAMPARRLSGGNRRKLELSRALLHQPALLICDEATVGLDLPSRRALLAHIRTLCRERGLAVLWTTHLMDEVEPDDQVVLLHKGRIRASGSAAELMAGQSMEQAFATLTREVPCAG